MEKEIDTLEKAREKLEEMLSRAEELGIDHPRHSEITVFDDGDFRIEVKKGESQEEITDKGFEKLEIEKLVYHDRKGRLFHQKVLQTEPHPSNEILEEEQIEI